jgi:hypothetical protein
MDIAQRVQAILLKPKAEWAKIKAEPSTVAGIFTSYALVLAAIPPGFQFLRRILIERLPVIGHMPIGRALTGALVAYVFSLLTVALIALIIDALAPSFSSTRNLNGALKLAVYSMTPLWIVGVFNIFSGLWVVDVLAGLYAFYILFLGFDMPLMDTPKNRVGWYFGINAALAIVVYFIVNLFLSLIVAVRYGQL